MKRILTLFAGFVLALQLQAQVGCQLSPMQNTLVCYEIGCNTQVNAQLNTVCGIPGTTYLWQPGNITGQSVMLCPGTYTVIATDACGCSDTGSFTINQNPQLFCSVTSQAATCSTCPNGTATANPSGGTAPYFYQWNTNPVQNTQTATGLLPGNYNCTVVDANGCLISDSASVTFTSGISEAAGTLPVTLLQNPVNGQAVFRIGTATAARAEIDVFSVTGERVYNFLETGNTSGERTITMPLHTLAAGVYQCRITAGKQQGNVKLVVNTAN